MRIAVRAIAPIVLLACLGAFAHGRGIDTASGSPGRPPGGDEDHRAVEALAAQWVEAVASNDVAFAELLSRDGAAYYPRIRKLALYADPGALSALSPIDQLQVMFLRLMLEPEALRAMSGSDLLAFALDRGLFGHDLRRSDVLREITVSADTARGRLYKFGHADRPDRSPQYFVRESGRWRVELRGELERLQSDFDAFCERSGLSSSEAAFFILETRLMRKVYPADFVPPLAHEGAPTDPERAMTARVRPEPRPKADPILRLVAIRHSMEPAIGSAVTVEDRVESLRTVMQVGDALPSHPNYIVDRIERDAAVFRVDSTEVRFRLDPDAEFLDQRLRLPERSQGPLQTSLLEQAEQGLTHDGLMAQWRNVGLRGRAHLLQQAWLTPEYAREGTNKSMRGLRVRKITAGSFWHQLGLQEHDVLTEINGRPVDSFSAWQQVIEIAENDQSITVKLERSARELGFRTTTIRPRSHTTQPRRRNG